MAIEIRELIITATIEGDQAAQPTAPKDDTGSKEQLIQECVDQVLRILKEEDRR